MTIDNFMFLSLAYWETISVYDMFELSSTNYVISLLFEWFSIPVMSKISKKLKSSENIDVFDVHTNFTPFSLDVNYSEASMKHRQ